MKKIALIVAGGSGVRMGTDLPKQFLIIQQKPVIWHTLTAFLNTFDDLQVVLVLPEKYMETGHSMLTTLPSPSRIRLATGGKSRFHSVLNGLQYVPDDSIVFVHDGVRCLVSSGLIQRCYQTALLKGNAVPAISSIDSIRIETSDGNKPIDRSRVKIIQTPQTFFSNILKNAYLQEYEDSFTDEASVVEKAGNKIQLVQGEVTNIKITLQTDLLIAEKILEERAKESIRFH